METKDVIVDFVIIELQKFLKLSENVKHFGDWMDETTLVKIEFWELFFCKMWTLLNHNEDWFGGKLRWRHWAFVHNAFS